MPSDLFFLTDAERLSVALPSLAPFLLVFTGMRMSTIAPHAEPCSSWLTSMAILPPAPLTPFTLPLALALSSAAGGVQPCTPGWLMQTPAAMVHEPLAVETPSKSHDGSQSVQVTTFFLPS